MAMQQSCRIQRSVERASFDHDWLQTSHSFSFAGYVDPNNMNWGALRVFNDDVVAPDQGFGTHPHSDMEILTYVLEGQLTHRDSMGNVQTVYPGGVQYLSAGTGITHSEYNASKTESCHFVQMWVIPRAKGLQPQYGQVDFLQADRQNRWLAVASGTPQVTAPITIWQDAFCSLAQLRDASLNIEVATDRHAFLFIAAGEIRLHHPLTQEEISLCKGDALRLHGALQLEVSGDAELVKWDTP